MRIAIIEDDPLIRQGLEEYISSYTGFTCILAAESVESFMNSCGGLEPADIILLDINLPGMSGVEGIRPIKHLWPAAAVIMLTIYSDTKHVFDALKAGADGYLLKNTPMDRIMEGMLQIQEKGAPMSPAVARKVIDFFNPPKTRKKLRESLTARETDILQGLADGLTYSQVGEKYFISIETVRHHVKNIYSKLQVNTKVAAVTKYLKGEI
ncbi:MAG: response regulator transcription factor [Saprospiraceae bacterium]|nr:response regulator transcription factor [Saprospiraceae bacterium]